MKRSGCVYKWMSGAQELAKGRYIKIRSYQHTMIQAADIDEIMERGKR